MYTDTCLQMILSYILFVYKLVRASVNYGMSKNQKFRGRIYSRGLFTSINLYFHQLRMQRYLSLLKTFHTKLTFN
jgi:hypothetical protein